MDPSDHYSVRLAGPADAGAVAALWLPFVRERAKVDRSLRLKPDADFGLFVERELEGSATFCWLLEHRDGAFGVKIPVGCLVWFLDDEPPDPISPFEARRCGKVLGLYVDPAHRGAGPVSQLTDQAIAQAESLGVTDIDVLVSAEQTGMRALLESRGFGKAAVQYTRHYPVGESAEDPGKR